MDDIIYSCNIDSEACNIHCFCVTGIKIIKSKSSDTRQSKWIYGNYYKHFMKHLKNNDESTEKNTDADLVKEKKVGRKVVPITNFFKQAQLQAHSSSTSIEKPNVNILSQVTLDVPSDAPFIQNSEQNSISTVNSPRTKIEKNASSIDDSNTGNSFISFKNDGTFKFIQQ